MLAPMISGEPEVIYLRRFFDGVDKAVTDEMQAGRTLLEESLTFVLARLLDGQSTFQRILDYRLDSLNADLDACGSGSRMSIEFETNEHKKSFESAVSHADLGIVVRREASVFGSSYTKALIVQSKKLYPLKDFYSLRSVYGGFDAEQFRELKKLASKYGWDGVCYFLYNPRLDAFPEDEAKTLGALEARMLPSSAWSNFPFPFWHPDTEYLFHKFMRHPVLRSSPALVTPSADELRGERTRSLASKPGLRVLGVSSVGNIVESNKSVRNSFRLEECYRYALSDHWWGNSGTVPFLPFSSFVVDLLLGCIRGSDNENLIRIAEGKTPEPEAANVDEEERAPGVAVRHTMRITVHSTLPPMDIERFVG
jgi:hypothetical protein